MSGRDAGSSGFSEAPPSTGGSTGPAGAPPGPGSAPEVSFTVEDADVVRHAAVPTLGFRLRVDAGDARIRSLSLDAQVRIAAADRRYDDEEKGRLYELFGAPSEWGRSLRTLLWTRARLVVPSFEGATTTELAVPCTYDFEVTASKYLHAVREGDVPLEILFSGTVFFASGAGLRAVRLPWDREARFRMPAELWHEAMRRYFPNRAWIRLAHDEFEALLAYRRREGLPNWERTVRDLLERAGAGEAP